MDIHNEDLVGPSFTATTGADQNKGKAPQQAPIVDAGDADEDDIILWRRGEIMPPRLTRECLIHFMYAPHPIGATANRLAKEAEDHWFRGSTEGEIKKFLGDAAQELRYCDEYKQVIRDNNSGEIQKFVELIELTEELSIAAGQKKLPIEHQDHFSFRHFESTLAKHLVDMETPERTLAFMRELSGMLIAHLDDIDRVDQLIFLNGLADRLNDVQGYRFWYGKTNIMTFVQNPSVETFDAVMTEINNGYDVVKLLHITTLYSVIASDHDHEPQWFTDAQPKFYLIDSIRSTARREEIESDPFFATGNPIRTSDYGNKMPYHRKNEPVDGFTSSQDMSLYKTPDLNALTMLEKNAQDRGFPIISGLSASANMLISASQHLVRDHLPNVEHTPQFVFSPEEIMIPASKFLVIDGGHHSMEVFPDSVFFEPGIEDDYKNALINFNVDYRYIPKLVKSEHYAESYREGLDVSIRETVGNFSYSQYASRTSQGKRRQELQRTLDSRLRAAKEMIIRMDKVHDLADSSTSAAAILKSEIKPACDELEALATRLRRGVVHEELLQTVEKYLVAPTILPVKDEPNDIRERLELLEESKLRGEKRKLAKVAEPIPKLLAEAKQYISMFETLPAHMKAENAGLLDTLSQSVKWLQTVEGSLALSGTNTPALLRSWLFTKQFETEIGNLSRTLEQCGRHTTHLKATINLLEQLGTNSSQFRTTPISPTPSILDLKELQEREESARARLSETATVLARLGRELAVTWRVLEGEFKVQAEELRVEMQRTFIALKQVSESLSLTPTLRDIEQVEHSLNNYPLERYQQIVKRFKEAAATKIVNLHSQKKVKMEVPLAGQDLSDVLYIGSGGESRNLYFAKHGNTRNDPPVVYKVPYALQGGIALNGEHEIMTVSIRLQDTLEWERNSDPVKEAEDIRILLKEDRMANVLPMTDTLTLERALFVEKNTIDNSLLFASYDSNYHHNAPTKGLSVHRMPIELQGKIGAVQNDLGRPLKPGDIVTVSAERRAVPKAEPGSRKSTRKF